MVARPVISADCVRTLSSRASCRRCEEVCHRSAIGLTDGGPRIDSTLCDSCELCVGVCPEQVFESNRERFVLDCVAHDQLSTLAIARCDAVRGETELYGVACYHSLGLRELSVLVGRGVSRLVLQKAECESCPRGNRVANYGQTLESRLSELNTFLVSRGVEPVVLEYINGAELSARLAQVHPGERPRTVTRRELFRFAPRAIVKGRGIFSNSPDAFPGLSSFHEEGKPPAMFSPVIEQSRCTTCGTCVHLCPHDVLTEERDDDVLRYWVHPERCTGCAVCADECDDFAVRVQHLGGQSAEPPSLYEFALKNCGACGAAFAPGGSDGSVCHVCRSTNHRRNLYQVLEDDV